jgi:hypothetical protein
VIEGCSTAPSFRDPGGSVSVTHDRVIRTVFPAGIANLDACLGSLAARRLVESGDLVATTVVNVDPSPTGRAFVEHPRIPFISYPCEWPSAMLHAAARLTLRLCSALLDEGLGLKDATPFNILFHGPRPVFVDVLSIEQREPLDPIWLADAQFARTFLIPLLLNRRISYPMQALFLSHRDGLTFRVRGAGFRRILVWSPSPPEPRAWKTKPCTTRAGLAMPGKPASYFPAASAVCAGNLTR